MTCAFGAQGDLVVDLTDLTFADTTLMLDLAMLSRRLRRRGRMIVLRGAQPQIKVLITLVGLDRLPGVRFDGPTAAVA